MENLDELGFCVRRIENVKKNSHPLPLFFVENNNYKDIFNLSPLLNTVIEMENPHKTSSMLLQYQNYQEHT